MTKKKIVVTILLVLIGIMLIFLGLRQSKNEQNQNQEMQKVISYNCFLKENDLTVYQDLEGNRMKRLYPPDGREGKYDYTLTITFTVNEEKITEREESYLYTFKDINVFKDSSYIVPTGFVLKNEDENTMTKLYVGENLIFDYSRYNLNNISEYLNDLKENGFTCNTQ